MVEYAQRSMLWSPQSLTAICQLRADASLAVGLHERFPEQGSILRDRRIWHPPQDPRWLADWLVPHLLAFVELEQERLAEHRALMDL